MKDRGKLISGLDIQSDYLTIAQYAEDENAVVLVAIQPINCDEGVSALEAAAKELDILIKRFKFTNACINCSLPGDYAIVKKVPVDPEEKSVHRALSWELGQHIVGSLDEYVFDYESCGKSADGIDEYLIVAYRKGEVDNLTGFLKRRKLTPGVVDIDLFSLINVFEANYPDYREQPALILHAETEKAKMVITHHGKYIDHQCFDYTSRIDPNTFAGLLNRERIRLCSFATLSKQVTSIPIFACGGLFVRKEFLETSAVAAGNVEVLNPFRKIKCRVSMDNERLSTYIARLPLAVGLSLRGDQ